MKSFMTIPFLGKWSHLSFSNSWWHPLVVFSEIENIFHLFIHTHYKVVKSLWDHKGTFWQITKYQNELLKRQQWLYNKLLKLAIVWFCVREDICMLKSSLPFFFSILGTLLLDGIHFWAYDPNSFLHGNLCNFVNFKNKDFLFQSSGKCYLMDSLQRDKLMQWT